MNKKIMVVFGTRPEAIKMLPIVSELRKSGFIDVISVSTGQHREMLKNVLPIFNEKIDIDLDIMKHRQTLDSLTSDVLRCMSDLFLKRRPNLVLVHGDTTTAMASALAAFYAQIPIGHVEAGLRSRNMMHPWPEEMNRVLIDSISTYLYAPTITSKTNLQNEASVSGEIIVTGNTGIDALFIAKSKIQKMEDILTKFPFLSTDRKLLLVTGHRRENIGQGFTDICKALQLISERDDVEIVYPVHLNPAVQNVVREHLSDRKNINLIDPVDYVDMVMLMEKAYLILTDSGGVQEEAPALGKPVLVMRDVTERPEAVAAGVVKIVGTNVASLVHNVELLLDDKETYTSMARHISPYGDGHASARIVNHIASIIQ